MNLKKISLFSNYNYYNFELIQINENNIKNYEIIALSKKYFLNL